MVFAKFDRNSVLFFSKIIKLRCGKWGKICVSAPELNIVKQSSISIFLSVCSYSRRRFYNDGRISSLRRHGGHQALWSRGAEYR